MKKVIVIILCLLCTVATFAVSYASPYRGSARSGYTSSAYHSVGSVGVAQRPKASMGSTSSYSGSFGGRSAAIDVPQVQVIGTVATNVRYGQLAEQTYAGIAAAPGMRKDPPYVPPDICPECVDEDPKDGKCDVCGCILDSEDGCTCEHCRCPIGDGWQVWLFLALLSAVYAFLNHRKRHVVKER